MRSKIANLKVRNISFVNFSANKNISRGKCGCRARNRVRKMRGKNSIISKKIHDIVDRYDQILIPTFNVTPAGQDSRFKDEEIFPPTRKGDEEENASHLRCRTEGVQFMQ